MGMRTPAALQQEDRARRARPEWPWALPENRHAPGDAVLTYMRMQYGLSTLSGIYAEQQCGFGGACNGTHIVAPPSLHAHKQHVHAVLYADVKKIPDRPCTQVCTPEKAWALRGIASKQYNNIIANVMECTPPQAWGMWRQPQGSMHTGMCTSEQGRRAVQSRQMQPT